VDRKALDANQQLLAEEEAVFDPLSRLTIQRGKLWVDQQAARNVETRIVYDPLGNVLRTIDPLLRETRMSYDAADWGDCRGGSESNAGRAGARANMDPKSTKCPERVSHNHTPRNT
jgi:hypothetical protein